MQILLAWKNANTLRFSVCCALSLALLQVFSERCGFPVEVTGGWGEKPERRRGSACGDLLAFIGIFSTFILVNHNKAQSGERTGGRNKLLYCECISIKRASRRLATARVVVVCRYGYGPICRHSYHWPERRRGWEWGGRGGGVATRVFGIFSTFILVNHNKHNRVNRGN